MTQWIFHATQGHRNNLGAGSEVQRFERERRIQIIMTRELKRIFDEKLCFLTVKRSDMNFSDLGFWK